MAASASELPYLIDVSRLIWRVWRGLPPTGIDRVCLAYVKHFGPAAFAVIQRRGHFRVLSAADSERLFAILTAGGSIARRQLAALLGSALLRARRAPPREGMIYFNVGHTGLDEDGLLSWVASTKVRPIYLVHDLIPLTHPEFCRAGERTRHERRMRNALSSAFGVIGNSNATLRDLELFAAQRGMTMPAQVAAWISGSVAAPDVAPMARTRPYFVTIGTIEGRKNHTLLLQIWRRLVAKLGDDAPDLVIIGHRGWEAQAALAILDRASDLRGHVHEFSRCEDLELAQYLRGARALLMPSHAEGFGLPVIEALQLGTPVIASDLPVYREIAHDIPMYLDSLDGGGWEAAILDFLKESNERQRQLGAMNAYRSPTWDQHFETVEKWLKEL